MNNTSDESDHPKRVFMFEEGSAKMKMTLGGKGANLAEMTSLGLPIPPGFTITTTTCNDFLANDDQYPSGLMDSVKQAMSSLEQKMGKKFGDNVDPLLVSVRSGAAISMPGMMDTVLNLGLTSQSVQAISAKTGERFAYDSYRRFIQMYGDVVRGVEHRKFSDALEALKSTTGVKDDTELTADQLKTLVATFKTIYKKALSEDFPEDPWVQLDQAIQAVFLSWNTKRAIDYRAHEGISDDLGTAVNIQTMVFGNMGENSASGVAFTRNPATGDKIIFGEYLLNAQGEDVVAGTRTPLPIEQLEKEMPELYKQFEAICQRLEAHYTDVQDIEFTIMERTLFILQTRTGKRGGVAAAKIAYDLVQEGMIQKQTAVERLTARDIENSMFPTILWANEKQMRHPEIEQSVLDKALEHGKPVTEIFKESKTTDAHLLGCGLPAGPGAASGQVVFTADEAEAQVKEHPKKKIILVTDETTPEDFHGMVAAKGILTLKGGMTSHAALVARQIGKRCIVGAETSGLRIPSDASNRVLIAKDGTVIKDGDWITVDGFTGNVFKGILPIVTQTELSKEWEAVLDWADEFADMVVRANADSPSDFQTALGFKAQGIGLARTEHQFFEKNRLPIVQNMIMADTFDARKEALAKLLTFQISDFEGLFRTGKGRPVTIRLIDPPLHEFLPKEIEIVEQLHKKEDPETRVLLEKVKVLKEMNPMLGFRGCRLSVVYPEITEMQVEAIITAALNVKAEGIDLVPEIMIPFIGSREEFDFIRKIIETTISWIFAKREDSIKYLVGTMIEVPRAALVAGDIAAEPLGAEFFSFGTNDLHQMGMGFSRDDIGVFLPSYMDKGILEYDPFQTIDIKGIGRLMRMTVEEGHATNPDVKVGICGEQGGDPRSIEFCYELGLDYVSCSPFRVPVARLACAHATLKHGRRTTAAE